MTNPVVVAYARTPFTRSLVGGLANVSEFDLASTVIREVIDRAGVDAELIDNIVMGEVLQGGGCIARYSALDMGLQDFRDTDQGSMLRVKGSDTLCPVGPTLVTDWDFHDKRIRTLVNGEVRQDGSTAEMTWDMHYLVADLARTITLLPGDMIFSGTPAMSRPVQPGDVVTVEVEGLGALTNTVVTGPTPIRDDVGHQPTESEEVLSTALGGDWEFRGIRPPKR